MDTVQDLGNEQLEPSSDGGKRLTTWYAQGHTDGLGDRLLMFDNTSAPSWEILRFRPSLAASPKFETALRQRVDVLTTLRHPAFPVVRPITELGQEEGLAVVSTYASGVCLTEGLKKPRNTAFGVRLLRQLVPAIAALQRHADGMAHGALTIDRLVLTSEGRLMIREHMVGSAIASLSLSPERLWTELGILAPVGESGVVRLDRRCDVVQIALVAVSMMAGRRIRADEYPEKVRELLDEIEDRYLWHEPETFPLLRGWLERALQIAARPFTSAADAHSALSELRDAPKRTHQEPPQLQAAVAPPSPTVTPPEPVAVDPPSPVRVEPISIPVRRSWYRDPQIIRWAAAVVAVVAIGEAFLIGRLMFSGSNDSAGQKSAAAAPSAAPQADRTTNQTAAPVALDSTPSPASSALPTLAITETDTNPVDVRTMNGGLDGVKPVAQALGPPTPAKSGGFRVSSPVEVHVLDGERVLGSSDDGPIIAPVGRHEFEFVNSAIGYRARRVVDIRPGEITALSLTVPNGTLNINATPWASVWIDGNPVGDTPLGNLSVTPGEHEVVFRHPQFGERRERTIVRTDATTKVAVTFQ